MQCVAVPELCEHQEFPPRETPDQVPRSLSGSLRAWYTVMPPGDFLTRLSLFDLLAVGGIPVVFNPNYNRFLPFTDVIDWDNLLVYIPMENVTGPNASSYVHLLDQQHDVDVAQRKLTHIHQTAHVFQYSLYSDHRVVDFASRQVLQANDDAFTMKAVLRNVCARNMSVKCATAHGPLGLTPAYWL